jgi:SNF family Na+-dependent transporter
MFDVIDQLTSSVLLPICGLALAIFGGWVIPAGLLADELALGPRMRGLMQRVLRYVAIPGILAAAAAPLLLP